MDFILLLTLNIFPNFDLFLSWISHFSITGDQTWVALMIGKCPCGDRYLVFLS